MQQPARAQHKPSKRPRAPSTQILKAGEAGEDTEAKASVDQSEAKNARERATTTPAVETKSNLEKAVTAPVVPTDDELKAKPEDVALAFLTQVKNSAAFDRTHVCQLNIGLQKWLEAESCIYAIVVSTLANAPQYTPG